MILAPSSLTPCIGGLHLDFSTKMFIKQVIQLLFNMQQLVISQGYHSDLERCGHSDEWTMLIKKGGLLRPTNSQVF
jgi:hypothetical protein